MVLPYAKLRLLMRQIYDGGRTWSLPLGEGLCLRRIGEKCYGVHQVWTNTPELKRTECFLRMTGVVLDSSTAVRCAACPCCCHPRRHQLTIREQV